MSLSGVTSEALRHPFVEKLGWALLHFVWQGAIVAIVVWSIHLLMRRASANARYLVACGGLLLTGLLPMVTIGMLPDPDIAIVSEKSNSNSVAKPTRHDGA